LVLSALRIDKLLWHLRLSKSRSLAQLLIGGGHVRLNGVRIEKSSVEAKLGDVLTVPRGTGALVICVLSIPARRGPPAEARACYEEI
jgi:ribosome-associated heat shock protein Hsp15